MAKRGKKAVWLLWLGQAASFLCLIHCLATVALTFVAPSLLKMLPHNIWFELAAWIFVLTSSLFLMTRASKRKWHGPVFLLIFLWGTTAFLLQTHPIFSAAFITLALFQLYLTLSHHLSEHVEEDVCCQHPEHAHNVAHTHGAHPKNA